jgi:septal ring factor EnvC (AmiA/AmiB activator)
MWRRHDAADRHFQDREGPQIVHLLDLHAAGQERLQWALERLTSRRSLASSFAAVLASAVAQRAERSAEVNRRPATLKAEVLDAEEKLKRLDKMVGDALTDLDEILKARIAELKLDRDRAPSALDRVPAACVVDQQRSEAIARFGRAMRENITDRLAKAVSLEMTGYWRPTVWMRKAARLYHPASGSSTTIGSGVANSTVVSRCHHHKPRSSR